mmetsp:Transcript_155646/g.274921  ORF Transcript_155646/g.274921 Transcript_155646/m.274921 type:complete len:255 (-) Transcript_155646:35-799(-)
MAEEVVSVEIDGRGGYLYQECQEDNNANQEALEICALQATVTQLVGCVEELQAHMAAVLSMLACLTALPANPADAHCSRSEAQDEAGMQALRLANAAASWISYAQVPPASAWPTQPVHSGPVYATPLMDPLEVPMPRRVSQMNGPGSSSTLVSGLDAYGTSMCIDGMPWSMGSMPAPPAHRIPDSATWSSGACSASEPNGNAFATYAPSPEGDVDSGNHRHVAARNGSRRGWVHRLISDLVSGNAESPPAPILV